MRIGIFGGTFNPPHIGHMIAAEHVRTAISLEKILFVPAATPPHKMDHGIVAPQHRVEMLRLCIQGNQQFDVSDLEIARGGVSFTIDTLTQLNDEYPDDRFYLLIGMDNLLEFHTWKSPETILELATVVVMTRPGFAEKDVPLPMRDKVKICPVPEIGVASRDVRQRVREKKSIRYLVAESVREYIYKNGLYHAQ